MGYYINPVGRSKEQWLKEKGEQVSPTPPSSLPSGKIPICLIQNAFFTAAAIVYSDREFAAFNDFKDPRPKSWFLVNKSDLEDPGAGADAGWQRALALA